MSKKRLYEIAKELGKESKEVVARAKELGLEVKSHASSVEAAAAEKIVASFKPAAPKAEAKASVEKKLKSLHQLNQLSLRKKANQLRQQLQRKKKL